MLTHNIRTASLACLLALAGACNAPTELIEVEREEQTTPSGVQYHDLREGSGDAATAGTWLTVDYVAQLTDGTELDSSYDRGLPIEFQLGRAPVAGWNEGLEGMRAGGRRKLVIPAHLAFGDQGVPGRVPPGATLIYEIELVAVRAQ